MENGARKQSSSVWGRMGQGHGPPVPVSVTVMAYGSRGSNAAASQRCRRNEQRSAASPGGAPDRKRGPSCVTATGSSSIPSATSAALLPPPPRGVRKGESLHGEGSSGPGPGPCGRPGNAALGATGRQGAHRWFKASRSRWNRRVWGAIRTARSRYRAAATQSSRRAATWARTW